MTKGYPKIVKLLIDKGADVNAKDRDTSSTALHSAVRNDNKEHYEIAKLLIKADAYVNACNSDKRTPLNDADGSQSNLIK